MTTDQALAFAHGVALRDENVGGLEVAMEHAFLVCVLEGVTHLQE